MKKKSEEIFEVSGIGPVRIVRSSRARYLNITVKPFKGVRVSVPLGMSYKSAARIVNERKEWIKDAVRKVELIESKQEKFTKNTDNVIRNHKLVFEPKESESTSVKVINGTITVTHPKLIDPASDDVQAVVKNGIVQALRIEAAEYLPERVKMLSEKYGLVYNKLTLKNIKSRWGSCSRVNNINLSIHLMTLPDDLIDYVILHELVHTKVKNHSKKFWRELAGVCTNAKKYDKNLRNYRVVFT